MEHSSRGYREELAWSCCHSRPGVAACWESEPAAGKDAGDMLYSAPHCIFMLYNALNHCKNIEGKARWTLLG